MRPATSRTCAARCSCSSTAVTWPGRSGLRRQRARLAARARTQVQHPGPGRAGRRGHHEHRRLVLGHRPALTHAGEAPGVRTGHPDAVGRVGCGHRVQAGLAQLGEQGVAVARGAQRQAGRVVVGLEQGPGGFEAEHGQALLDDPRGVAGGQGQVRDRVGRGIGPGERVELACEGAQHAVDEPAGALGTATRDGLAGQRDAGVDGGPCGHLGAPQLQRPEAQDPAQGGLDVGQRAGQHAVEQPVERAGPPDGVVGEVGGEAAVAVVGQVRDRVGDGRGRPRPVLVHRGQGGQRGTACRQATVVRCPRHRHAPSRVPSSGRCPLAQAAASMRGLPSGWTTVSRTWPCPQATTGPSSSATSSPGAPGGPSATSAA